MRVWGNAGGSATVGRRALARRCAIGLVALALPAIPAVAASASVPTIAYVTETATTLPSVWAMGADGSHRVRLGRGTSPLVAPGGQQVAVSLFGTSPAETGPALGVYSTTGLAPLTYLSLAGENVTPLSWSHDGRYLAIGVQSTSVANGPALSGLAILDMQSGAVRVIARGEVYGASFSPGASDEVVYGLSASLSLSAPVNLYRSAPDGSGTIALTHDGRSLFPIWGPRAIAYDRERLRRNDAPVFQIWLRSPTGSAPARRLTHIRVRSLVSGLVPLAFSGDGRRLLAEFGGEDTSEAWTVRVPSGRARRLRGGRRTVQAAGLSSNGATVLVDEGGFEGPASSGRVALLPFGGGRPRVLVAHGSQSSWNG